jgi:hypothetical protein
MATDLVAVDPPICGPTVPPPCVVIDFPRPVHQPIPVDGVGALAALSFVIVVIGCCVLARRVYERRT